MELTRKQIIALIIATSEKESPFRLTYDTPLYEGRVSRSKENDCWDLQYLYKNLEYRLFGGSHERGFQMITFINEAEASNVVPGFDSLAVDISTTTI